MTFSPGQRALDIENHTMLKRERTVLIGFLTVVSLFAFPVQAAEEHKGHDHASESKGHAHESKAERGGVVFVAKDTNFELVNGASAVRLYVSDHGKPVDLAGASGRLTALSKAGKAELNMTPSGDSLQAGVSAALPSGAKVAGTVTLKGQPPVSVRFTMP